MDFQDQIYFALGNMAMREGKEEEALEYYLKSAKAFHRIRIRKADHTLLLQIITLISPIS